MKHSERTLEEIMRFDSANTIADLASAFPFLSSELPEDTKRGVIDACLQIKAQIDTKREKRNDRKTVSEYEEAYHLFRSLPLSYDCNLSKRKFLNIYMAVTRISFDGMDTKICKEAQKAVSELFLLNKSRDSLIHILDTLIETKLADYTASLFTDSNEEFLVMDAVLGRVTALLKRNRKRWFETLCALCRDPEYNDINLENKFIYYRFTSNIDIYGDIPSVNIIEPAPFFIQKWLEDTYMIDVKTTFVFRNKHICNICKRLLNIPKYSNISFITYDEYLSGSVNSLGDMLLIFGNHIDAVEKKEQLLNSIQDNIRDEHFVGYFDSDINIGNTKSAIHSALCNGEIECIDLLPSGLIDCTKPERKMYVALRYGYTEEKPEIDVFYRSLVRDSDYQGIAVKPYSMRVSKEQFWNESNALRKNFRVFEESTLQTTDQKRKKPAIFDFSPELCIAVSIFSRGNNKTQIRARMCFLTEGKPTAIWESKYEPRSIPADIETWAKKQYPYVQDRKEKNGVKDIRKIVSEDAREQFKGRPISVKSCIYFYPEIENRLSQSLIELLDVIVYSEIAEMRLDKLSSEWIDSYLLSMVDRNHVIPINGILKILDEIYKAGIANGHCRYNPIESMKQTSKDRYDEIDEVNSAIGKRFLDLDEIKVIIKKCKWEINEGNTQYIAVLIRMLTGLEANMISALTWRDLIKVSDEGMDFYQLRIEKRASNDGKAIMPLMKKEHVRTIPLQKQLTKILLNEKNRRLAEQHDIAGVAFMEQAIIPGPIVTNNVKSAISPASINSICRQLIRDLNIHENYIDVPENEYGVTSVDLNSYRGDILKNSFRHYLVRESRLLHGDLNYLLGIAAPNTAYQNYIACDSTRIQERILIAMEKLCDLFEGEES